MRTCAPLVLLGLCPKLKYPPAMRGDLYCPILLGRCRFCSFLKLLSYRHTAKYLLFFKAGQADAMTACFSEYSRKVLSKAKSNRVPIREQLKQAADQLSKEKPKQKERAKEVAHEDR